MKVQKCKVKAEFKTSSQAVRQPGHLNSEQLDTWIPGHLDFWTSGQWTHFDKSYTLLVRIVK